MSSTAIYLRVSTVDQSLASQRSDLERWEQAHAGICRTYEDSASGRSMDRPAFVDMMSQVRQGKVSRIVCWRLDRLGRTAAGLTALFAELIELDCTLVSIREGIDLATPAGRLMAHVLASVAAYETEVRKERVAAGIIAAKASGKKWGGRKTNSLNSHTAKQLLRISNLRKQGIALSLIAQLVGLSVNTVKKILRATEE